MEIPQARREGEIEKANDKQMINKINERRGKREKQREYLKSGAAKKGDTHFQSFKNNLQVNDKP